MKKIGITGGILPPNMERNIFKKKQLCYLEKDFANYWASFGVMPILIPNLEDEFLTDFLLQLDGLALMGGTDISPLRYNEKPIGKWLGDPLRDSYEFKILDWFVQNDLPVFGTCRGFQLLNVYFGGTLYQDLPTQYGSPIKHADMETYDLNLHQITVEKNELFDILNICKTSNKVNSLHHQCVKDLGQDLSPLAYSEDGLIEAFYYNKIPKGKIMGTQWHPEFSPNSTHRLIDDRAIIQHFLNFCA